jgi:hypothetical protein
VFFICVMLLLDRFLGHNSHHRHHSGKHLYDLYRGHVLILEGATTMEAILIFEDRCLEGYTKTHSLKAIHRETFNGHYTILEGILAQHQLAIHVGTTCVTMIIIGFVLF